MRFEILNGLTVLDDADSVVPIRSEKRRRLLAMLLIAPGHAVSVDHLIDALWGNDAAPDARSSLQLHVHRLRPVLGDASIVHQVAAYQLLVDNRSIDAHEFEQLALGGRQALGTGDLGSASDRLDRALAMWQGQPLAGFEDIGVLRQEALRLSELHMLALEARCDARLKLGDHLSVIPDLSDLVREYPLQQGFCGQLMLALHRAGRPEQSLVAFDKLAEAFDEIGLEPSAELHRLRDSIAESDPALDWRPVTKEKSWAATIPAELPPSNAAFTGRQEEIAAVTRSLTQESGAIVALHGPGGIGKSALATEIANAVASRYENGQIYVNLHGSTPGMKALSRQAVLAHLLRSLGMEDNQIPSDPDEAAGRFRSLTADRRVLILLDNAVDPSQVRPLVPNPASGSSVLTTSRLAMTAIDNVLDLVVGELPDDESAALLAKLAGADRVASEVESAAEIVRLTGRIPLAIKIAGARLASRPDWSLAYLVTRLADSRERLEELQHSDLAVRASCDVGFDGLPVRASQLFARLGLLDLPDFTATVVAELADCPIREVRRDLDDLVESQLLQVNSSERYSFHDLIRLYAREKSGSLPNPEAALRRVAHWYLATAIRASDIVSQGRGRKTRGMAAADLLSHGLELPDGDTAAGWIRAEMNNFLLVAAHGARVRSEADRFRIAWASATMSPLLSQGLLLLWLEIGREALTAADRLGDLELQAWARRDIGNICHWAQLLAESWEQLHAARALFQQLGDRYETAMMLAELARVRSAAGEQDEAIRLTRESLDAAREFGVRQQIALGLNNLGSMIAQSGRVAEARPYFAEAVAMQRERKVSKSLGMALGNLGEADNLLGNIEDAARSYQEAVEVFRATGQTFEETDRLWDLADVLDRMGKRDDALDRRRRSVELAVSLRRLSHDQAAELLATDRPAKPVAIGT